MLLDTLNQDFRDMLVSLCKHRVDFVVVGAYALAVNGHPRATVDFDVLVQPSPQNAALVMAALREFGAPLAAHAVSEADFAKPGTVYQIGQPPRRIDVLTEISGVTYEEARSSGIVKLLGSGQVRFLGREALIKNKRAAGRPKDLADVDRLTRG